MMKKNIRLALTLLLMLALALTGCGGAEEPPVVDDPAVGQDAGVTKSELIVTYNEFAELFNELDQAFVENGIYDTNEELKANMDHAYELLGMYPEIFELEDLTDQEMIDLNAEMKSNIDSLNRAKEAHL